MRYNTRSIYWKIEYSRIFLSVSNDGPWRTYIDVYVAGKDIGRKTSLNKLAITRMLNELDNIYGMFGRKSHCEGKYVTPITIHGLDKELVYQNVSNNVLENCLHTMYTMHQFIEKHIREK